jgi:glycosyltransferase involved in cell wall biosynthesis
MTRHICVDGLFLHPAYGSVGISRYLVNLLLEMERIQDDADSCKISVLAPRPNVLDGSAPGHGPLEIVHCPAMPFRRLWRLGFLLPLARRTGADALFLPSPVPVYVKPMRLAVTMHDIIPLLTPEKNRSAYLRFLCYSYLSSLRKADLVLTDSEYSRQDLIARCGIAAAKIVVAYLGFDDQIFKAAPPEPVEQREVLARYGVERPYVLHVGTLESRKNLLRLIQAYRDLLNRRKDFSLQLVLCGRASAASHEILDATQAPGQPGRVIVTGPVPDGDLSVLYRAAAACAMPSLYEGFGLPLLEAMASATPVMSSNASCLPEIAGDAALYFNPESVEEMSHTMERLLSDAGLRKTIVDRGLGRVRQFSWAACARTTLAALKSL